MNSDSQDGLFDEALVERVEPPVDGGVVEAGAGVNKRFKAFEPDAVMLVPPSLDEWLPQNHLTRFIADLVAEELDLSRIYGSYAKTKGQPPYDPRLMVRDHRPGRSLKTRDRTSSVTGSPASISQQETRWPGRQPLRRRRLHVQPVKAKLLRITEPTTDPRSQGSFPRTAPRAGRRQADLSSRRLVASTERSRPRVLAR